MKQRKKLPYLALFIDDWMASAKVRKCSETTRGVYTDLLCILHKEPRRGSYSLHDQELKPNNTRSKTQLALAKPSEYQRLPYFAEFLVKRTGSSKTVILKALQELFERKILVIEGDTLIQPRMYRDSGYRLLSDMEENEVQEQADGEQENSVEETEDIYNKKGVEKGTQKSTKKETQKSRARASHERAHIHNGSGSENNIDNSSNKGGAGGEVPDKPKTQKNNPKEEIVGSDGEKKSGVDNLSSDGQKRATKPVNGSDSNSKGVPVADNPPTLEDIQQYMHEQGELGKFFRFITAEQFYDEGCMNGWTIRGGQPLYDWKARLRSLEAYRRKNGEQPVTEEGFVDYKDGKLAGTLAVRTQQGRGAVAQHQTQQTKAGDPVPATKPTAKKYKDKW